MHAKLATEIVVRALTDLDGERPFNFSEALDTLHDVTDETLLADLGRALFAALIVADLARLRARRAALIMQLPDGGRA